MNEALFENFKRDSTPDKEKETVFILADLEIRDPQLEKGFMITYNADGKMTEDTVTAYTVAVREILKDYQVFHQLGNADQGGMQGWELWRKVSREEIEALLPRIHERAKELYEKSK